MVALIALALAPTWAADDDAFGRCVLRAADRHLAAKGRFQLDLRDLIVRTRPEYQDVADVNMDLQIALAQARRARMAHLVETSPARVKIAHGLATFANFSWSEAESQALVAADPAYRDLESRIAFLEARNNGHPDWPALRDFMRAELAQSPEFKKLVMGLRAAGADVEKLLGRCGG